MTKMEWFSGLLSRKAPLSRRRSKTQCHDLSASVSMLTSETLEQRLLLTFDIQWDYSFDTSGFFNDSGRRAILEEVAAAFEERIEDDLTAITPGGGNSWTATITHPATGAGRNISNPTIPADTIVIYVGARNLGGSLGLGGPGGFSGSGNSAFLNNLSSRGESGQTSGSNATEFAPWGGSVSFDSTATWHFGLGEPPSGQNDFFSVALHETAHVFGFGTSASFNRYVTGGQFVGPRAVAENGANVPMDPGDASHFLSGLTSTIPGTTIRQEAAMDPALTTGSRKVLTDLDWASLDDIGWTISTVSGPVDYGDAPDATDGTGAGNYQTRLSDNGPRHSASTNLYIGSTAPDSDNGLLNNGTATADDDAGTGDEGFIGSDVLAVVAGASNTIEVNVTNQTGEPATLLGWIDFNGDGAFASAERATVSVPASIESQTVSLNFSATTAAADLAPFQSILRLRLTTDTSVVLPTGPATDGEVEDHSITVYGQEFAYDSLPLFTWPSTSGATYYELEVNNLTTGTNQVILQSELYETRYRPEQALVPGTYQWRYRPFVGGSFQPFSAPAVFSIFETEETPFITDPVAASGDNGVSSIPTIAWSPYADAERYELWIDDLTRDLSRIVYNTRLTTTSYRPEFPLQSGDYRAFVRAADSTGAVTAWSRPYSFSVASTAGNAGEVTSPVGTSTNAAPTIAFRPVAGPARLVVTDRDTSEVVVDVNGLSRSAYTPPNGLPAGRYEAQVFVNGADAPGESQRFQIEAVSGAVQITRPGADTNSSAPTIGWTAVTGATRYSVWVDDVSNGVSRAFYSINETGTAWQPTGAMQPGTYRVWVRAFDGFTALTAWSTPVTFQVRSVSAVPLISAPVASTTNALPHISWADVSDATQYDVDVLNDEGLVQSYVMASGGLLLDTPLAAGSYSVQVTARQPDGTIVGTDIVDFSVEDGTTDLQLFGTDGSLRNPRPTFSWSAVPGATRYSIWVNDDTNGLTATVFDSELTETTYLPPKSLLPGTHRVWVRAFDGTTPLTAWSAPSTFFVMETAGPPQIIHAPIRSGLSSVTTTNTVPAVTWTPVSGASSYELQVLSVLDGSVLQAIRGLTETTHRPVLGPGTFDLRVRSFDSSGAASQFSSTYRLDVVASDPGQPTQLVLPVVRSTVGGSNVLFGWTFPAPVGVTYDLWVSNLTTGSREVFEQGIDAQSLTAETLPAGKYRAWVRAIGPSVNSAWSTGVVFTVAFSDVRSDDGMDQLDRQERLAMDVMLVGVQTDIFGRTHTGDAVTESAVPAATEMERRKIDDLNQNPASGIDGPASEAAGMATHPSDDIDRVFSLERQLPVWAIDRNGV